MKVSFKGTCSMMSAKYKADQKSISFDVAGGESFRNICSEEEEQEERKLYSVLSKSKSF